MAYRNKTFVSFDGDNDIHYYRLMRAWKQSDHTDFVFHDAHDINYARDTSTEQSIKAQLAERLRNSSVFILLIGERTKYLRKFVPWEIEQALRRDLPIIGVNLNGMRQIDNDRCPPQLAQELAVYVSFNAVVIQHALESWPTNHIRLRSEGRSGPYYYNNDVYKSLGL